MKRIFLLLLITCVGAFTLSAQEGSTRKQKRQQKAKSDSTQLHWQGDGKNWPADTIHHMINGKDSINKY